MEKWLFLGLVCLLLAPGLASAQESESSTPIPPAVTDRLHHWYDDLSINMYADAFYMVDWNHPKRADAEQQVAHRAYDFTNGFALAFAGLDLAYAREHFGATVSLIYGRGADRYLIGSYTPGFFPLKQAFVSWVPTEDLSVDVGQFDTPFGAEVAQSWLNLNYSRSPLNYLMQPFYHTGIRATWQATDVVMLRGLLVNGMKNGIDSNLVPSVGGQIGLTPNDSFALYVGYLGGAPDAINQNDPTVGTYGRGNRFNQHFFDAVLTANVNDKLKLVVNGDFWVYNPVGGGGGDRQIAGGVSATVGYQITDEIAVAARGDYLGNADGFFPTGTSIPASGGTTIGQFGAGYATLGTPLHPWKHLGVATITLDYRPFGNHAVLRLEHRIERADKSVYPTGGFGTGGNPATDPTLVASWSNDMTKLWMATTLSLVVQMAE